MAADAFHSAYLEIRIEPGYDPWPVEIFHHLPDGRNLFIQGFSNLHDKNDLNKLKNVLKGSLGDGVVNGFIDISGIRLLNSAGLKPLVEMLNEFRRCNGLLALIGPVPHVQKLLKVTKLDQTFTLVNTKEEALEKFGQTDGGIRT